MAEELIIRITGDVDQAREGIRSVGQEAENTATSLTKMAPAANQASGGLDKVFTSARNFVASTNTVNTSLTTTTKTLTSTVPALKNVQTGVSRLGDTLETLRAKALAKQEFIKVEKNVANIARLNREIQELEKEILRVQSIGKTGFDDFGNAVTAQTSKIVTGANEAFSALRKIAYIIPGLGIAGIISLLSDQIISLGKELFGLAGNFSEAEIAAAKFRNELESLDSFIKDFKGEFDFSNEINKLKLQLQFGKGFKADFLGQAFDVKSAKTQLETFDKILDDNFKQINGRLDAASFVLKKKGKELFDSFGQEATLIPDDLIEKLGDGDKKFISELKALSEQTKKINEQRGGLVREIERKNLEIQVDAHEQQLKEQKEFIEKLIQQAKKIQQEFPSLVPGDFKIFDLEALQSQIAKAKDIIADFRRGFGTQQELRLKLIPKITINKPDFGEIEVPEITIPKVEIKILNPELDVNDFNKRLRDALHRQVSPEQFARDIKDLFGRFELVLPFKLILELDAALRNGDTAKARAILAIADMNEAIRNAVVNITAGLGETIGEAFGAALAGGDLNAIFKDFGELVGQQVQELGKLLIKLGIQQQIAIKALASVNPLLQIAAGIALVAIGAALKNALGKGIEAREKGGPVEKGKPYIVGEKGYELFIPQQSGTIVSHDKLIQAQSVRENNSIREYFAHRQIADSIKAIETRLTNVVYKISEQSDRTNKALVERFTTHSEAINKFVQTSITATNERTIDAIRYFTTKDKSTKEISDSYIKLVSDKVSNFYKDFYVRDGKTTTDRSSETIVSSDELKKIISNNQFEKTISSTFSDFVEKVATKTDKLTESFSNNYKEFYSTVTNQIKEFHYKTSNEKQFNSVFESILKNTKENYSSRIDSLVERLTNNSEKQTITSKLETITSTLKSFTDKLKISVTNNIFNTSSERLSIEKLHTMFKIPKFEFGGLAFGPTLGILGEGFGISRSNPEVVAPLNQLKGILGGEFGLNISIDGQMRLSNNDLLLQVNRAMKTTLRTTGRTGL